MPDVVLVSMPFGPVFSPSIGLSLLKAELGECGITSRIEYCSIRFAETIGRAFYSGIASGDNPALTDLAGEWIFAGALFGGNGSAESAYVDQILLKRCTGHGSDEEPYTRAMIARILRARTLVDAFLERSLDIVVRDRPKVVGLTSVFQQHVASLALARRIKQALPSTFVVLGGANCEGVMGAETVRQFPFVDAVVSGEADLVFPELVRRVLGSEPIADLQGVRTRARLDVESAAGRFENAPPVRDMDRLPFPDYSDYFEQFKASRYDRDWQPRLFFESSRGCWWGERMHCTFCGLNGSTMAFRSKSARRALDELTALVGLHPGSDIQVVDNILDMGYFKDFVPELGRRRLNVSLFYETKSNLKKEQLRLLRAAGIRQIQPGIESFSDPVLKMMRKGVTGLQNIQLLKWCKEMGIQPSWNVLWGFPGESPEEYARMARLVPLLTHLPAPVGYDDIRLDRFSPNFFDAANLGLCDVTPLPAYRHIYPVPDDAVANLAYYFAFGYQQPRDVRAYVQPLVDELDAWKQTGDRSDLFAVDTGAHLHIWDLRPVSAAPLTTLTGLDRVLYNACDAVRDRWQLAQTAAAAGHSTMSTDDIERVLAPLVERRLLLQDGSRYLALAISLHEYAPAPAVLREFWRTVAKLGVMTKDGSGWIIPLTGGSVDAAGRRGTARRDAARTRAGRRRRMRGLVASQFLVDGQGRLVIQAAGVRTERERSS